MMVIAFAAGFISMLVTSTLEWYTCLAFAAVSATVAAYVEPISQGENDTVTVPIATAFVLSVLSIF